MQQKISLGERNKMIQGVIKTILPNKRLRDKFLHTYDLCQTNRKNVFDTMLTLEEKNWFQQLVETRPKEIWMIDTFSRSAKEAATTLFWLFDSELQNRAIERKIKWIFEQKSFCSWEKRSPEEWEATQRILLKIRFEDDPAVTFG